MKKIAILLAVLLLLATGCAQSAAPVYDTTPATLPQLDGETAPATTQEQLPAQTEAAQTEAPEATRPTLPRREDTPDIPIDQASICVSKVLEFSGRRPQLGEPHVFPIPAEQVTAGEITFSAQLQDDSVLVTLHTENCYQGTGISGKVSEFTLGLGDEINIAIRGGDTETAYQFKLVDGEQTP